MSRIGNQLSKAAERRFPIDKEPRNKMRTVALGVLAGAAVIGFVAAMVVTKGALHSTSLISIFQGVKHGAEITAATALSAYIGILLLTRDTQEADKTLRNLRQNYIQASENDIAFENRMTVLLEHKGNERSIAQQTAKLAQEIAAQQGGVGYPKAIKFAKRQFDRLVAQTKAELQPLKNKITIKENKGKPDKKLSQQHSKKRVQAQLAFEPLKAAIDKLLHEAFECAKDHFERGEIKEAKTLMNLFEGKALDELRYEKIEAELRAGGDIASLYVQLDSIVDHKSAHWATLEDKLAVHKTYRFLDSAEEISEAEWQKIDELIEDRDPGLLKDRLLKSTVYTAIRLGEDNEMISAAIDLIDNRDLHDRLEKDHRRVKRARIRALDPALRFKSLEGIADPVVQASLKIELHREQRLAKAKALHSLGSAA